MNYLKILLKTKQKKVFINNKNQDASLKKEYKMEFELD
tara:strand:+ start:69 stop:182 length:114 start_codon:yes stop_codon:yes gene_type:complete